LNSNSDIAKVELTGDIVKKLEDNTFNVSVKRDDIEYIISAEEFTISNVANNLGVSENDLKDIKVEVKIAKLDSSIVQNYNDVAKSNGSELIFPPVAFEIIATTTKSDGTYSHVPTQVTREEAMTMYKNAMSITHLVGNDANRYQVYTDYSEAAQAINNLLVESNLIN